MEENDPDADDEDLESGADVDDITDRLAATL
jgi:hypothetical protein